MCGVWGFVTTKPAASDEKRRRFLEYSAVAGTLRGDDSTGAFFVSDSTTGTADWCKVLGDGHTFVSHKEAQSRLTYQKVSHYWAAVGHNRSATRGSVILDNAHPFQEGDITLVHNGTLDTLWGLPSRTRADETTFEVDSHLICHNLALHSVDEVVDALSGAFTLIWHDARDQTLRMIRNDQRPLHLMHCAAEGTMLFASEPDMLWWLAGRAGFTRTQVVSVDPYVLLEFKEGSETPTARKLVEPRRSYYSGQGSSWYNRGASSAPTTPSLPPPNPPSSPDPVSSKMRRRLKSMGLRPSSVGSFELSGMTMSSSFASCYGTYFGARKNNEQCVLPATVYGMDPKVARENSDSTWLVRPVAVSEPTSGVVTLICKFVGLVADDPVGAPDDAGPLPGPDGDLLAKDEWRALTESGCCQCRAPLSEADADEIVWMLNRTAMCPSCVDEWRNDYPLPSRRDAV
jgi:hypothetical protein